MIAKQLPYFILRHCFLSQVYAIRKPQSHPTNLIQYVLQHPNDMEQRVLQRLEVYREFAEELMDCYEWGQHVNADQDPLTVFEVIESLLVNALPIKSPEA